MDKPIYVSRAFLPDKQTFSGYIDKIFDSHQLTNNGPLLLELEEKLKQYLRIKNLLLCANGTLALMLAIKALDVSRKKVIVTPFTYVATLTALLWEGCTPLFADIDPKTLCISPKAIEQLLEQHADVAAIVPVHVYGNACDIEKITNLAHTYHVPVIYDASHAFNVEFQGNSIFEYGDISICSLHATKIFHTVEGGYICCHDKSIEQKIQLLRAFGHINDNYFDIGINAKLSEVHAAMGLSILPYFPQNILDRKKIVDYYDQNISKTKYTRPQYHTSQTLNYAYYPLIFPTETDLLNTMRLMSKKQIYPRRYFYPSCNTMPYLQEKASCPISEDISRRILCLPLYAELEIENINKILECL